MKSEKELRQIYKKYIDKQIYRVIPIKDYRLIKKKGIIPKQDKYNKISLVRELLRIINNLEKRGFVIKYGSRKASHWLKITIHDLEIPYVDFAPIKKDIEFYLKLKGGASSANVRKITKEIIKGNPELTKKEWGVVRGLNGWAKSVKCKNIVIVVSGDCKCFETARFQLIRRGGRRKEYERPIYLPSPFGGFEHFKKVIKKQGYKKYAFRLKSGKYYLRVKDKILAEEVKRLR
tara:strand:+ start:417 stop:1115 length:699 start_codon:yes stop_codon:yes gene_type:complete